MRDLEKILLPPVCGGLALVVGYVLCGPEIGLAFGFLGLLSGWTKARS